MRGRTHDLAMARPRFGFTRLWRLLHLVYEWLPVNITRVRRLYRVEGVQLRMRLGRRTSRALYRGPAPVPSGLAVVSKEVVHRT